MKNVKSLLMMLVVGAFMMLPVQVFAEHKDGHPMDGSAMMGCPHCQMMSKDMDDHMKTMSEAAEALKTSNPELSKKLSDMVEMKQSMMMKMKEDMKGESDRLGRNP